MTDPTVETVIDLYRTRSDEGMAKYGVSMADNPGDLLYWLNHLQQELMDGTLYAERAMDRARELEMLHSFVANLAAGKVDAPREGARKVLDELARKRSGYIVPGDERKGGEA